MAPPASLQMRPQSILPILLTACHLHAAAAKPDIVVVLVDDMVSTGGSIVDASRIVKEKGARNVYIVATHAVLPGNAVDRLNNAEVEKILFADTIPLHDKKLNRLEVVSIAPLLARAIDRIHRSESVSKLFEPDQD